MTRPTCVYKDTSPSISHLPLPYKLAAQNACTKRGIAERKGISVPGALTPPQNRKKSVLESILVMEVMKKYRDWVTTCMVEVGKQSVHSYTRREYLQAWQLLSTRRLACWRVD